MRKLSLLNSQLINEFIFNKSFLTHINFSPFRMNPKFFPNYTKPICEDQEHLPKSEPGCVGDFLAKACWESAEV